VQISNEVYLHMKKLYFNHFWHIMFNFKKKLDDTYFAFFKAKFVEIQNYHKFNLYGFSYNFVIDQTTLWQLLFSNHFQCISLLFNNNSFQGPNILARPLLSLKQKGEIIITQTTCANLSSPCKELTCYDINKLGLITFTKGV
jgi:hypothetical protein